MRQAICILTLLVLTGCSNPCTSPTDCNVPYRIVTASRSAVVIEAGVNPDPFLLQYSALSADRRSYLLTKAQSECDRYGKDAVLVRRERLSPRARNITIHYRCEPRMADPIIDVK